MKRILFLVFFLLVLVQFEVYGQIYIDEDFTGSTLSSAWEIVEGNSSNFSVSSGMLNILNTYGGVFENPWSNVAIRTSFNAPDSFYFSCRFDYQRTNYRGFDIYLRNGSGQSVAWFRLWDSPGNWILVGRGPGNPECYGPELQTAYVPSSMQIYRSNDTGRIIWDGVEQWSCVLLDTTFSLELRFSDCYGASVLGITIDNILAWSGSCCLTSRGDLNFDGSDANILDLTFCVNRIFRGGPPAICPIEADVNNDGTPTNILDLTYLVNRIFRGGPAPGGC